MEYTENATMSIAATIFLHIAFIIHVMYGSPDRDHDICTTWGTAPLQTSISPSPDVSTTSAGQPQNSIVLDVTVVRPRQCITSSDRHQMKPARSLK
jgi:hypothetical protein